MQGVYNRQGRKSGGYRKSKIPVGRAGLSTPNLSIQCFEDRHKSCNGYDKFFGIKCTCRCHSL